MGTSDLGGEDRDCLRRLAARVRHIAGQDDNRQRRERAFALNACRLERPFVLCIPEGAWRELVTPEDLECRDPTARLFEEQLRKKVFQYEQIGDDAVIEDILDVRTVATISDWGVPIPEHRTDALGAATWDPPITDIAADLPRLRQRCLHIDRAATDRALAMAEQAVGDLVLVREYFRGPWSVGLTSSAIALLGLEGFLLALYDDPDGLHRLMAWLRDDQDQLMDQMEASGLLCSLNGANSVGSGGIGYTVELPSQDPRDADFRRPITFRERWGLAESQETVGVSPAMFSEFVLPYQMPLLARFGLTCYGCCEGLEKRIDQVLTVPRLRRVSVAPWADQAVMAEKLGRRYVYSRKPNPSLVCVDFNQDAVRRDVRSTLEQAAGCCIEFVLKDTHTVQHQRDRFARWTRIAREEIDRCWRG
ncbi:MAG: hypothetical protein ACOCZK_07075 [Planctomycetota bacterium]